MLGRLPEHLRDPTAAPSSAYDISQDGLLEELGLVHAAYGDYSTAKSWFTHACAGSMKWIERGIAHFPAWPHRIPRGELANDRFESAFHFTIAQCAMRLRMAREDPEAGPEAGLLRPALEWSLEYLPTQLDPFLARKPHRGDHPAANGATSRVLSKTLLPSMIVQHSAIVQRTLPFVDALWEWHERVGLSWDELAKRQFVSAPYLRVYRALVASNREEFVEGLLQLGEVTHLENIDRSKPFFARCYPNEFALFLQGATRFEGLKSDGFKGVPPGLTAAEYWRA